MLDVGVNQTDIKLTLGASWAIQPLLPPLTPHTSAYPLQTTYHLQNYTYLSELLHRHNPTHALRCANLH